MVYFLSPTINYYHIKYPKSVVDRIRTNIWFFEIIKFLNSSFLPNYVFHLYLSIYFFQLIFYYFWKLLPAYSG